MCTISIKVNDILLSKARLNLDNDVEIAEWMQQQIEAILIRMAYALSPEILAIVPKKRHSVYGDYKEEVTEILEEKYK